MRIRNQIWIENDTQLVLTLYEPYWSAWQRYGWPRGVEGFGVSVEAIKKAKELKKHIRINTIKYGSYEATTDQLDKYSANVFVPRDGKAIIVAPRIAFKKIQKSPAQKIEAEKKEEKRAKTILQAGLF